MIVRPVCPTCQRPHLIELKAGTTVLCGGCQEVYTTGEIPTRPPQIVPVVPVPPPPPVPRYSSNEGRVLLLLGLGAAFVLAVLLGVVGLGVWLVTQDSRDADEVVHAGDEPSPKFELQPVPTPQPEPPTPKTPPPDPRPFPIPAPKSDPTPKVAPTAVVPVPKQPETVEPVPFNLPINPYKLGTQTRLRELRSIPLPAVPTSPTVKLSTHPGWVAHDLPQFAYSPTHDILFVRWPAGVWVYDVKAGKELGMRPSKERLADLSLAPDESALFVTDHGGPARSNGSPVKSSYLHRFDLTARTWETRSAPAIARQVEAVGGNKLVFHSGDDPFIKLGLYAWPTDGGVSQLAKTTYVTDGDLEFNPRSGIVYHVNHGHSAGYVHAFSTADAATFPRPVMSSAYDVPTARSRGKAVLSHDGAWLYFGRVQIDPTNQIEATPRGTPPKGSVFPEGIVAASRDVAFGAKAYYRPDTFEKLGEYPFATHRSERRDGSYNFDSMAAIAVSPDGLSVWVMNAERKAAVQFALEGEKKDK